MGNPKVTSAVITLKDQGGGVWGSVPPLDGAWQLPSANYIPQKLAGEIISPRPDSETDTNGAIAYYRKNHSQVDYEVRICVVGMAWPFQYSIISAPTGATIGAELTRSIDPATGKTLHKWGDGYAVVKCSAANMPTGTSTFSIRVTAQDGQTKDVTWSSTRDDSAFVFLDEFNGLDTNDGSFELPLQTFITGLWKDSEADSTYAGKIAVYRAGTYLVGDGTVGEHNIHPTVATKPMENMAYPGDTAYFDHSNAHWWVDTGDHTDFAVIGMQCINSRASANNVRVFNFNGFWSDRVLMIGNTFSNVGDSLAGNDNPACIAFMGDDGGLRKHCAVVDNVTDEDVRAQLVVTFGVIRSLAENNVCNSIEFGTNTNGSYGINIKDDASYFTVRANKVYGNNYIAALDVISQNRAGGATDVESCWNTAHIQSVSSVTYTSGWNSSTLTDPTDNTYSYRNSLVNTLGFASRFYTKSTTNIPVETSAIASFGANGDSGVGVGSTEVTPNNVTLTLPDFNTDGELVGQARNNNLGIKGAEVAA